jgi:hypothetical protein
MKTTGLHFSACARTAYVARRQSHFEVSDVLVQLNQFIPITSLTHAYIEMPKSFFTLAVCFPAVSLF